MAAVMKRFFFILIGLIVGIVVSSLIYTAVTGRYINVPVPGITYEKWLWYKLIGLVTIVFVVNLIYTLVTGQSIEEARRGKDSARDDR